MQRDPRLVALSREHHAALRLGRALMAGTGRAALDAQRTELAAHFAEEEARFLPLLAAHDQRAIAQRLRQEHVQLDALFTAALRGEDATAAGQALIDHVRFEERELFPLIETLLPAATPLAASPRPTPTPAADGGRARPAPTPDPRHGAHP